MDDELNPNLWRKVSELELPERAARALEDAEIRFIGELVQESQAALLALDGFGKQALRDVRFILADMGLDVGLGPIPQWSPPADGGVAASSRPPIPARDLEWDKTPEGIAIFVKPAFATVLATRMRTSEPAMLELEDLVLDGHTYGDNGFFFDDDNRLVITMTSWTKVIDALQDRQHTIEIGDEVRIHVRD